MPPLSPRWLACWPGPKNQNEPREHVPGHVRAMLGCTRPSLIIFTFCFFARRDDFSVSLAGDRSVAFQAVITPFLGAFFQHWLRLCCSMPQCGARASHPPAFPIPPDPADRKSVV